MTAEVSNLKPLVEAIIRGLVDVENAVEVRETRANHLVLFEVKVAAGDFGKLLGRQGEHAKAMRTLLKSIGKKHELNVNLELIDPRPPARS